MMKKPESKKSLCILIIEDDPEQAELLKRTFKLIHEEWKIILQEDAAKALSYLEDASQTGQEPGLPHVIFLDLRMPEIDGLDVLESIRKNPAMKDIPVIVYTASEDSEDIRMIYRKGGTMYLKKPVQKEALQELMQQVIITKLI